MPSLRYQRWLEGQQRRADLWRIAKNVAWAVLAGGSVIWLAWILLRGDAP